MDTLLGVVNPNHGKSQQDLILDQIRKAQLDNYSSQQGAIAQTQGQIADLQAQKPQGGQNQALAFGLLADMFSPGGGNNAQLAASLQKADPRQKQLDNLNRQLLMQQRGLGQTQQDILSSLSAEGKLQGQMDLANLQHQNKMAQIAAQNAAKPGAGLTPGEKKRDEAFGKEASNWDTGGFAKVQGNLKSLGDSLEMLKADKDLSGSILPGFARDNFIYKAFNPKDVALEQNIQKVTFQSLKDILGGAFSKEEAERLVNQAYDPNLSREENIKKLQNSFDQLQSMASAKQAAVDYFNANGTLKGFSGKNYNSIDEYMKDVKEDVMGMDPKDEDKLFKSFFGE